MRLIGAAALALVVILTTLAAQAQIPDTPGIHDLTIDTTSGTMSYALAVPRGYSPERPVPLVLVLHSGGERIPHYGREFMKLLAQPALSDLGAVMIAPDCPSASWTDVSADTAVMTLLRAVEQRFTIDRRRVLVTGYSMGGRGTWFMAAHHADVFTAAIPMAAATGDESIDRLATIPTYVIHSRNDEVVPFAPAERNARQLADLGRTVRFEALTGPTHFEMFRYVDALRRGGRWVAEQWR